MKKTTGIRWGGLKVGIVLMFAIAVLLWASLSGGGTSIFEKKATYRAFFRNVNGLVSGSPVWMAGVEVGNVRGIDFVNLDSLRRVQVNFTVKESVLRMVTRDAHVQLGTIGFLGDKYIEVLPGVPDGETLPEGSVIAVRDAGSVDAVFKEAEAAAGEAKQVAAGIDTLLERMNAGVGTLGQLATNEALYEQMTELSRQLTTLVTELQRNQERLVGSVERSTNAIADLSQKLNDSTGSAGKLVNDPALYNNLSSLTSRLDTTLAKINQAEGSLGLLVNDTTLYIEMANLLARSNRLIKDIQDDPKKYLGFSIF